MTWIAQFSYFLLRSENRNLCPTQFGRLFGSALGAMRLPPLRHPATGGDRCLNRQALIPW